MKDILKSGVLGLGTAALANNPEMLRGFGRWIAAAVLRL
jgi:hypothetical protein